MYVIIGPKGKYAAKPGSRSSYTTNLKHAQKFPTKEAAEANRCPENERAVRLREILD